jgi:hypothetical protein
MKNRLTVGSFILLLVVLALAIAITSHTHAQAAPGPKVTWEYAVITSSRLQELGAEREAIKSMTVALNKLGEDGWELVAVEPGHPPDRLNPMIPAKYVFKRQK